MSCTGVGFKSSTRNSQIEWQPCAQDLGFEWSNRVHVHCFHRNNIHFFGSSGWLFLKKKTLKSNAVSIEISSKRISCAIARRMIPCQRLWTCVFDGLQRETTAYNRIECQNRIECHRPETYELCIFKSSRFIVNKLFFLFKRENMKTETAKNQRIRYFTDVGNDEHHTTTCVVNFVQSILRETTNSMQ